MNPIEATLSAIGAMLASLLSAKTFAFVATATAVPMPGWMSPLVGPFGAVVGLVVGLIWMAKRLDKSEAKFEARDKERDEIIKTVASLTAQTTIVIQQNSEVLKDIHDSRKP